MHSIRPHDNKRFFVRITTVLAVMAACVRGDIQLPTVPPPQPKSLALQVYKGESVEIPLEAISRSGYQVRFLIRKSPVRGTLSEPVLTSRTSASVIYTHDPKAGLGEDRLRYAAQTSNSGVSTPAEVILNVVERPPHLVAPTELAFDPTVVGEYSHRELELKNEGGGRITGRISLPEPWHLVAGEADYDLGAGESKSYVVVFEPTSEERYASAVRFSHDDNASVGLTGYGYEAISVVPREVRAEGDGLSEVRTAAFLIRNQSEEDREVRIEAPEAIIVEEAVKVPARSEVEVALHTKTGFLEALSAELHLTGPSIDRMVPLEVAAAPARVAASVKEIDFGTLEAGRTAYAKLIVRNVGGSPAELKWVLPEGMEVQSGGDGGALEPGNSREIELAFSRRSSGAFEADIVAELAGSEARMRAKANIEKDSSIPPATTTQVASGLRSNLPSVPAIESINVTNRTTNTIDLAWEKVSPNVSSYRFFLRTVRLNDERKLIYRYEPLPAVKVRIVRDQPRATLEGLRPAEQITIQIVGYDAIGKPVESSQPFTLSTLPAKPFRIPWTLLGILVIVGAAGVIIFERRKVRQFQMH